MLERLIGMALTLGVAIAHSAVTIWNVAVVDPASGRTRPAMLVEVEHGRIKTVEPAGEKPPSAAEPVVDGTGKFLMPGLWDNHVHLSKLGSSSLPLLVANGVTSVRDMGSDLSEVLGWRHQIEAGTRAGPRIKTPGQILESQANVARMLRERTVEPVERLRMPMAGPADARRVVEELLAGGADFIKVRTVPNRETFLALATACRERDVRLAGHPVAPAEVLARAGMASVEHALTLSPSSVQERNRVHNIVKRAGAYVGTTVSNNEGSALVPHEEAVRRIETDPRMRFVGSYLLRDWRE